MDKKIKNRIKRHKRVRARIKGEKSIPRVSVFRSNRHMFVQFVDDVAGKTILSNSVNPKIPAKGKKVETSVQIGKDLAKKAIELGIKKVVFDRGGYKYHGRVKALADGLRAGGLEF